MKAIELLKEEHRVIEKVLQVLTAASNRLEKGEEVSPDLLLKAVDFVRNFADKCHHGKEEGVLFPALEAAGLPTQGGPAGVMLIEHDQGRGYIKALAEATERLRKGDRESARAIVRAARSYVQLLSNHIPKEDNILYDMAEKLLPPQADEALLQRFEEVEEGMGAGVHERYHHLVEELEQEVRSRGEA